MRHQQSAKEIARHIPPASVSVSGSAKRGKIKFYIPERGFGFILPEDGGPDLFFHYGAVIDREPEKDDRVLYLLGTRDGRSQAVEVKVI
jgi:cold shock CspA family protein